MAKSFKQLVKKTGNKKTKAIAKKRTSELTNQLGTKTTTTKKSKAKKKKKPSERLAHEYSIEPRYLEKMFKIFKRCSLQWNQTEWHGSGEMNGYVEGEREDVLAFVMDAWKVSRRRALTLVEDRPAGVR